MKRIAYIAPEYGALTSTFIYREVQALRELGLDVATFSTLRPRESVISDEARADIEKTEFLYDLPRSAIIADAIGELGRHPWPVIRARLAVIHDALFSTVYEPADRLKMFWHGMAGAALAKRLREQEVEHIHAHFAHVATAIAMYASICAEIPFSFTNHANDIFQRGTALREKVRRSKFTACISQHNIRYLTDIGCDHEKLRIIRCALDVTEYSFADRAKPDPPVIFTAGRLVEKKGMTYLVEAVRILKEKGVDLRCRIAGNGPLMESLQQQVKDEGVEDRVDLMGSQPQERVRELLREATVFVLACVEAADGDIDGIPVSLMEAMAMGVPVISTGVSGIPELIHGGKNGLLATPHDAKSLAAHIEKIITDSIDVDTLTRAARETIESEFEQKLNAQRLKDAFTEEA